MRSESKIPEHWIARLFAKMVAIWGDGFASKWAGVDMDELKATWAEGLAGQNEAGLKRGYAALFHEKRPPDLPRFIAMCHIDPMYVQPDRLALAHEHRMTPVGEEHLAKIHDMLALHRLPKSGIDSAQTGIEWAFKIIREANDSVVPLNKLKVSGDAIRNWCDSHHCSPGDLDEFGKRKPRDVATHAAAPREDDLPPLIPSPHIYRDEEPSREPGEDDELPLVEHDPIEGR